MPFDVPEGWAWCKIEEIAESNIGLTYKPEDVCSDGIPVLRSNNIKNRRICTDGLIRVKTHILPKQFIGKGDLLICARNGSRNLVGKCALIEQDEEPMSFGAFMAVCRSAFNRWIFLILNSSYFSKYLDNSNSTAINQVTQSMLLSFNIPLPPKNEQARINSMVERLCSCVDELEKHEQVVLAKINDSRKRILELAIHGKLVPQDPTEEPAIELLKRINPAFEPSHNLHYGETIPTGWTCATYGILNQHKNRSINPMDSPQSSFELYSVPIYDTGKPEYLTGKEIGSTKQSVEKGDVLLCKINPHLNRAWVVEHYKPELKCIASSEWLIFKSDCLYPEYARVFFMSPAFRSLMLSNVSGVGGSLMRARASAVDGYAIWIPPYNEQIRIVTAVKAYYKVLDEIVAGLN